MPQSAPLDDLVDEDVDDEGPRDEELAEAAARLAIPRNGPSLPPATKEDFAEVEISKNRFSISVVHPDFEICTHRPIAEDAQQVEKPVRFYLGYWQLRRLAPDKDDTSFIEMSVLEEGDGIFLRIFDTDRAGNRVSKAEIQFTVQRAGPPTLLSIGRHDKTQLTSAKQVSDCLHICRAAVPQKPTRQSFVEAIGGAVVGVSESGLVVIDNALLPFEASIPVMASAKLARALGHMTDLEVFRDGPVLLFANDTLEIAIKVEPAGTSKPLLAAVAAARETSQPVEVDLERLFLNQFLITSVYNQLSRRRGGGWKEGSQADRLQPLCLSTRPGHKNTEAVLAAEVMKPLAEVAFMKATSEYSIDMPGAACSEQGVIDGGALSRIAGALLKAYGNSKISLTRCLSGDVGFFRLSLPAKTVNIYMAIANTEDQRFRNK
jgi:hypothetical protein